MQIRVLDTIVIFTIDHSPFYSYIYPITNNHYHPLWRLTLWTILLRLYRSINSLSDKYARHSDFTMDASISGIRVRAALLCFRFKMVVIDFQPLLDGLTVAPNPIVLLFVSLQGCSSLSSSHSTWS